MKINKTYVQYYLDFLSAMVLKDIKIRYKRAYLGLLWILINPLIQMLIIGLVFSHFIKINNYLMFLFPGLLAWQFFSSSVSKSTTCFINERDLLRKSVFPKEIIPISIILSNLLHYLIALLLLLLFVFIFFNHFFPNLLVLSLGLIWLLFFTLGLSLLVSSLEVRYRDVAYLVQSLLTVWFYATPIVYDFKSVPSDLIWLFRLNPLASIIGLLRLMPYGNENVSLVLVIDNIVISFFVVVFGYFVFLYSSKYFVDHI